MMRISKIAGDVSTGRLNHALRVKNVHLSENKKKVKLMLYTSKTHGKESHPQEIKISAREDCIALHRLKATAHVCPF